MPELVSFNPADCVDGGGILEDADVTIIDAKAVMFDYDGKSDVPVPGFLFTFEVAGGGEPINQFLSMGSPNDWEADPEGKGFIRVGKREKFVKTSNGMTFVTSAINAGFPADKIGADIGVMIGLECHLERMALERKNLDDKEKKTTIIVTKIHKLPGASAAAKGTKAGTKASKSDTSSTTSTAASAEVEAKAVECVQRIVIELTEQYPDGVPKSKLSPMAFKDEELKNDPDKGEVAKLVYKDSFLAAEGRPWTYDKDKGTVTL